MQQIAINDAQVDITVQHVDHGGRRSSISGAGQALRFSVPAGATTANQFVQQLNGRIASLDAQEKLQAMEKRRLTKRAHWIELLVSSYQNKLLELLNQPVGIAITAEEVGASALCVFGFG